MFGFKRRRQIREQQLDDELRFHIQRRIDDSIRAGMDPYEARRQAYVEFGGVDLAKEECRELHMWSWIEQWWQDLRYAARMLRKSPGFTAVAMLSLALGIGANTAVFSVLDALVLRTLSVREPQQLVILKWSGISNFPFPDLERYRGLTDAFSSVAAVLPVYRSNITTPGAGGVDPVQVNVDVVTGDYFSLLGVAPLLGRALTPDDDRALGGHPVAVISHAYWERRFARDPNVVGRTFTLGTTTFTILGVTPRNFTGEWRGRPTEIWIPVAMLAQVITELPPEPLRGGRMGYRFIARLRPGVSNAQAQAAAQVVLQQTIRDRDPSPANAAAAARQRLDLDSAAGGYSPQRESLAQPLQILMVVVGLVLLIACANVANLLLARAAARQREMAVRLAVGAGRSRLVRQLLTESVLLAMAGGALGLLFAQWGTSVMLKLAASGPMRSQSASLILDLHPNLRVLGFTTALCLLTGILFGLAPAFRASTTSIAPALVERGAGASGFRLGKLLVIAQVAVSLVLLTGAILFARTLANLKTQDLGFEREHLLLVWTAPGQIGRSNAAAASLFETIEQRIAGIPGVRSVSPTVYGMLQGNPLAGAPMNVPGFVPATDADRRAQWSIVGTQFFDTLGLRLLTGRNFTERDIATSPQVAILNERMARHFFGNESPLGRRFESWGVTKEVIGVVVDAKYESPREEGRRMFYLPYRQQLGRLSQTICIAIRTTGNPTAVASVVREEFRNIDPRLPVIRIETIEQQLDNLLVQERLIATLSAVFGTLAVMLACLGLYGVMAYSAARRTNEIGIRMALGATRRGVLGMVLQESLWLVVIGIAIGFPATFFAARLVASRLFGVRANDPVTLATASLLMIGVALLAAMIPARRASRIDPMVALRQD
jgi:predicted permease